MHSLTDTNQRLADRLLAEGRLSHEGHAKAIAHAVMHDERIEDALIDLALVSEADLLKYVATLHKTRFVSTEKLHRATVDPRVVALVSPRLADLHRVFPVLYDSEKGTLSIVTSDPDDAVAMKEVRLATGVKSVQALLARPAAITAAIQRAYHGDLGAFKKLLAAMFKSPTSTSSVLPIDMSLPGPESNRFVAIESSSHGPEPVTVSEPAPAPEPAPVHAPAAEPAPEPDGDSEPPTATRGRAVMPSMSAPRPSAAPQEPSNVGVSQTDYYETIHVLVTVIERSRPGLGNHSSQVAQLVRRLCARKGISETHALSYAVAALLHDVGKAGPQHLTALNVAKNDSYRSAASEVFDVHYRSFPTVQLWTETKAALAAMYERYGGGGLPRGSAGADIPEGARILAVCDSYIDITTHANNPLGHALQPAAALAYLEICRGTVFDPDVLDLLRAEVGAMHPSATAFRPRVLLVDPDRNETSSLELPLVEQGFDVRTTHDTRDAMTELKTGAVMAVVSEVDVEAPDAGLRLRSDAVAAWGETSVLWVLHTKRTDSRAADAAYELDVDDLIQKPAKVGKIAVKLKQLLESKRSRTLR